MSDEIKDKIRPLEKEKKQIKPEEKSVDQATIKMLYKAQADGVETIFDRAENMKPCNIGAQGTCCKLCAQGPCRLPLTKQDIEEKDTRQGLCGATPETIAARNFSRMVAAGSASHSDHGRTVAGVFLAAARRESPDYDIVDSKKVRKLASLLFRSTVSVSAIRCAVARVFNKTPIRMNSSNVMSMPTTRINHTLAYSAANNPSPGCVKLSIQQWPLKATGTF